MKSSKSIARAFMAAAIVLNSVASWLAVPAFAEETPLVPVETASDRTASLQSRWNETYGTLPLSFEANQGQFDSRVKFASRTPGKTIYLTSTEAILCLYTRTEVVDDKQAIGIESNLSNQLAPVGANSSTVLRMRLIRATPARSVEGVDELSGKTNYFIGNDPKNWRTDVKNYSKVRYSSVYPGIDLLYHSNQRNLEYDFIVAPGANPRAIRQEFGGVTQVRIDKNGDLVLETSSGEVRQNKPFVYQVVRGAKKRIAARYVMRGRHRIGFSLSSYDRRKTLVIDPVLIYSTYLGGSRLDNGQSVAVDNNGNAYITGSTTSINFPTANPFQGSLGGGFTSDVFVTKLNPTGSGLVYSTYIGGSSTDSGFGIAIDSSGNAYIAGQTASSNFPTANALQGSLAGLSDAFLTKLNPQGSMLVYSTYLGGTQVDSGRGIAVDAFGAAYISGDTQSPNFPLANALRSTFAISEGFVSKFSSAGTALVYSTYLGGRGADSATAIALDAGGSTYVTGSTRSSDFPTMNALQPMLGDKTLFKSTDGGASWQTINNGVPGSESGLALAMDPLNPATLYVGTALGLYKTTDAGSHWLPATQGLPESAGVTLLAVDPVTPSTLYAGTSAKVYKSTNGGANWGPILDMSFKTSIAIDPASPSTVFVSSQIQGVLVTTDGGATWENTDFPFASSRVQCLAIDPTHPGSFYAGTEFSGIHRYPAACANLPTSTAPVRCAAVSPASPATVYAGSGFGAIYKTTDAGVTWKPASNGIGDVAIAVDPISPQTVYAASSFRCSKSTDGGDNWTTLPIDPDSASISVNEIVIDPANPSTLYAAATSGGEAYVTKISASGTAYVYSTLLGGSGADSGAAIAVDSSGSVYVAGTTNSLDIPSASPLRAFAGVSDLMLTRITPDGAAISFFTYFGGAFQETAAGISVDSSGSCWVTGNTNSPDLPTTPDATPVNGTCESGSCRQAFVSKFSSDGTGLTYSSYLGGNTHDPSGSSGASLGFGVTVDQSGSAYVVGQTFALDFPTTPGAFQVNNGGGGTGDAFVSKIGSPCAYSLSKTAKAFPPAGGSGSFDLTTALGCPWTVVTSDSWILLNSSDTGTGDTTISFEVRENFEERFRIGTLAVGGQTYTVLQEGLSSVGCSNAISPTFGAFPSVGGNSSINVIAAEECIWEAASNVSWIAITSNDTGIGVGVVSYHVDANSSTAARTGTITIAGKIFKVKQKGNVGNGRSGANKS